MKKILSILLFIFTLLILPILIILNVVSPNLSAKIKKILLQLEAEIKGEVEQEEVQVDSSQLSTLPSYKESTPYISPTEPNDQPCNQVPDFEDKNDEILDDLDLAGFRYVLEYKDRFGNTTTRGIDITGVHKEYGNNRWYFLADTIDGERTFKSQRVISLQDQWYGEIYNTSKTIREHLLASYDVIEDIDD